MFVFNYWLRGFLLSAFANHFELRCETKQLMLLYYKICPCCINLEQVKQFKYLAQLIADDGKTRHRNKKKNRDSTQEFYEYEGYVIIKKTEIRNQEKAS